MKKVIKKTQTLGVSIVLFFILLLGLFSETVRTLPAGAFSEKFKNISYKLPKLNS